MATDWTKLTVEQLRKQLTEHNLDVTGNKLILINRLKEYCAANALVFDENRDDEEKVNTQNNTAPSEEVTLSFFNQTGIEKETTEEAESMDTEENGDPAKKTPVKVVKLDQLSSDELKAELMKRQVKATDWVTFLDKESDKKLLDELQKLNKITCFNSRINEINYNLAGHKVHVYPIGLGDMADTTIIDTIKMCKTADLKFITVDADNDPVGMLSLTFDKQSEINEIVPVLSAFKPDVKVAQHIPGQTWREDWRKMTQQISMGQHENMVYLPSLPKSITEDHMWDHFPKAKNIHLIDTEIRKHAYVIFQNPEDISLAVEALNAREPLNNDLKFCGMLHFDRMMELLNKQPSKKKKTARVKAVEVASQSGDTTSAARKKRKKKNASAKAGNWLQEQQNKQKKPNQPPNQSPNEKPNQKSNQLQPPNQKQNQKATQQQPPHQKQNQKTKQQKKKAGFPWCSQK